MEPEDTVEYLLSLIDLRPNDAELHQRLGLLYDKAGRRADARNAFERSLELDPSDPFTHLYLGNWYCGVGLYAAALERFRIAADLLPNEAVAYWCQGDAYRALGKLDHAQASYEKAVAVDPDDEKASRSLREWRDCRTGTADRTRRMIISAAENDQAATVLILSPRYLKAHPDDVGVQLWYADMLYQSTRYEDAIRVLNGVVDCGDTKTRYLALIKLGKLQRYRGEWVAAEAWFRRAIEENPADVSGYANLGAALARQGKLAEAEAVHRRGTLCTQDDVSEAHHNLGLVLRGQGRYREAAESFARAIELDPEYAYAIEALQDVRSALALLDGDGPGGDGEPPTPAKPIDD